MYNPLDLSGKNIIVAGGSSGIGRRTAITLCRLGATISLVARNEDKLQQVMQEMDGSNNTYYSCDLSNTELIGDLVKNIVEDKGKIDGLVYSAGVNSLIPLNNLSTEMMRKVFDINYFGFIEFVRQVCKRGRFNEGMRIVGVSSCASMRGDKSHTAYSASKSAMDSSVRCIAKEVASKGICINTVAPAITNTEMYSEYIEKSDKAEKEQDEVLKRQYLGVIETEDIANVIAFLMSPATKSITGITIPVDGGLTTS